MFLLASLTLYGARLPVVVTLPVVPVIQLLTFSYMLYENRKKRAYLEAHPELNIVDYVYHDHADKQNPFAFNVL